MAALTALAVASTAMNIYSSVYGGQQKKAAQEAQAKLYDMAADQRLYRAKINEAITREKGDRLIGDQIAAVGSSGRALSGSAFDLMYETANQTALEVLRNNELAEYEAAQLRYRGQLARFYGDQAESAGYINAGSAALDGAYKYHQTKSTPKTNSVYGYTGPDPVAPPSMTAGTDYSGVA